METIPQKELRNNVGEILRRAEAGEEFEITVSGRPVATLGPARKRQWVPASALNEVFATPTDPGWWDDITSFGVEDFSDPWELYGKDQASDE